MVKHISMDQMTLKELSLQPARNADHFVTRLGLRFDLAVPQLKSHPVQHSGKTWKECWIPIVVKVMYFSHI